MKILAALAATLMIAAAGTSASLAARLGSDDSETVMITFRPKPGSEAELAKVIASHWTTARRLDLVLPNRHLTLRADDERGRPYFVDIFTWRSSEIPDHAPADIQAIWADMTRLTESRDGKRGLDIVPTRIVE
jgi:hypothetical protein